MALIKAAKVGDLATVTRLVQQGVNIDATDAADAVSAALPAAPTPLHPSPSALATRRSHCPAHATAAHRVWRRRRASAVWRDGPHECGLLRQARLPRAPHRQGRQPEYLGPCAPRPCCGVAARGGGVGSERGRLRAAAPLPRGRAVPRWRRCAPPPPRRAAAPLPAAGPRPPGSHASRQGSERGCGCGGRGVGWGGSHPPQAPSPHSLPRRSPACVGPPPRLGR